MKKHDLINSKVIKKTNYSVSIHDLILFLYDVGANSFIMLLISAQIRKKSEAGTKLIW